MIVSAIQLGEAVGVSAACRALDLSRATFYRSPVGPSSVDARIRNEPSRYDCASPRDPFLPSERAESSRTQEVNDLLPAREARSETGSETHSSDGVPAQGTPASLAAPVPATPTIETSSQETVSPAAAKTLSIETASPASTPTATAPLLSLDLAPSRCRVPGRALSVADRSELLDLLHSDRFVDLSPAEVHSTLLDEGRYFASIRTYYRLLDSQHEVMERRNQRSHGLFQKPELLATAPNQVWSWDITKLLGPKKWTYYYLYVILDVFSRYVVGWSLDFTENSALAERLVADSCTKQGIEAGQLTLHADRGSSMTSKTLAQLMADLGITKTHSRPHVSNDNPFSEAQFKTLKYRPEFPGSFDAIEVGRSYCRTFFPWYNTEHHHSGLSLLTPEVVHYGRAEEVVAARQRVLDAAFAEHPERFRGRPPVAPPPPQAVWINPPAPPALLNSTLKTTELTEA